MTPASPCINVCQLAACDDDPQQSLCIGCYRRLDEIAAWSRATDTEKNAILDAVERRRSRTCVKQNHLSGNA